MYVPAKPLPPSEDKLRKNVLKKIVSRDSLSKKSLKLTSSMLNVSLHDIFEIVLKKKTSKYVSAILPLQIKHHTYRVYFMTEHYSFINIMNSVSRALHKFVTFDMKKAFDKLWHFGIVWTVL